MNPIPTHTPTPWQKDFWRVRDRHGLLVCDCDTSMMLDDEMMQDDVEGTTVFANTAFIVQCVNSHTALVEALTYLLNETEDYIKINHLSALHNHSLEMARAALALAQKEHR
jgi:hypothetical protein